MTSPSLSSAQVGGYVFCFSIGLIMALIILSKTIYILVSLPHWPMILSMVGIMLIQTHCKINTGAQQISDDK